MLRKNGGTAEYVKSTENIWEIWSSVWQTTKPALQGTKFSKNTLNTDALITVKIVWFSFNFNWGKVHCTTLKYSIVKEKQRIGIYKKTFGPVYLKSVKLAKNTGGTQK